MDKFICNSNTLVLLGVNFESLVVSKAEEGFQEDGFEYSDSLISILSDNLTLGGISWEKVGFDRLKIESLFRDNKNKFRFTYLLLMDCGVSENEGDSGLGFLAGDYGLRDVFKEKLDISGLGVHKGNFDMFQKGLGESLLLDCPYIICKNGFLTSPDESFMMTSIPYRKRVAEYLYDSAIQIEFNNRR